MKFKGFFKKIDKNNTYKKIPYVLVVLKVRQ